MTEAFLVSREVTKDFTERKGKSVLALDRVSLGINRGEFVTILGPSGCGKTTLLHMFAGLAPYFPPDAGELMLDGKKIEGPSAERGMVFQEYALLPWKTVLQNVALPLKFAGVGKEERNRRAAEVIDLVGLSGNEDVFPFKLSGGMRQRVAVARALVNNPKVLLMDEPFAAVDAQTRMTLQEELTRIWERVRNSVVFVTHSVQEALFLADRIIVLAANPGRVVADIRTGFPRPRHWGDTDNLPEWHTLQAEIMSSITSKHDQ